MYASLVTGPVEVVELSSPPPPPQPAISAPPASSRARVVPRRRTPARYPIESEGSVVVAEVGDPHGHAAVALERARDYADADVVEARCEENRAVLVGVQPGAHCAPDRRRLAVSELQVLAGSEGPSHEPDLLEPVERVAAAGVVTEVLAAPDVACLPRGRGSKLLGDMEAGETLLGTCPAVHADHGLHLVGDGQ